MYTTINDVKGEKRIDLFYPIYSLNTIKEIAILSLFSDNIHQRHISSNLILSTRVLMQ